MKVEHKLQVFLAVIVLVVSIVNLAYYFGTLRPYSRVYFPTDFQQNLLGIRSIVAAGTLVSVIGTVIRKLWTHMLSITSLFCVMSLYICWYFETLSWIKSSGVVEQTPQYAAIAKEAGWLHGANSMDYFVLLGIATLSFWFVFGFCRNGSYFSKQPWR